MGFSHILESWGSVLRHAPTFEFAFPLMPMGGRGKGVVGVLMAFAYERSSNIIGIYIIFLLFDVRVSCPGCRQHVLCAYCSESRRRREPASPQSNKGLGLARQHGVHATPRENSQCRRPVVAFRTAPTFTLQSCCVFPWFRTHGTKKPAIGMCLQPRGRTGAATMFLKEPRLNHALMTSTTFNISSCYPTLSSTSPAFIVSRSSFNSHALKPSR